jgi:hypothetical protein
VQDDDERRSAAQTIGKVEPALQRARIGAEAGQLEEAAGWRGGGGLRLQTAQQLEPGNRSGQIFLQGRPLQFP